MNKNKGYGFLPPQAAQINTASIALRRELVEALKANHGYFESESMNCNVCALITRASKDLA